MFARIALQPLGFPVKPQVSASAWNGELPVGMVIFLISDSFHFIKRSWVCFFCFMNEFPWH